MSPLVTHRPARRPCERANCRAPAAVRVRCSREDAAALGEIGHLPFLDVCTYHARAYEAKGWTREEIPPRAAPLPTPAAMPVLTFAAGRLAALDAIEQRIASASAPIWTEATERGKGAAEAIRAVLAIVREERDRIVPVPATTTGGPTS